MNPHIRGVLENRFFILLCVALVVIGGASAAFAYYIRNVTFQVTLNDNGHVVQIVTMEKSVDELLNKYGIALGPGDEIQPNLEDEISGDTTIQIKRAFKVSVSADGNIKEVYLTAGTVGGVLKKAGITLGDKDFTNYGLEQSVAPGTLIRVTRMEEEILTEKESVPYQVVTRKNNNLDQGVEKVVQEGRQGEIQRKILVSYRDGVEISRKLVEETVAQQPIDRVVEKGTVKTVTTSRGDTARYSSVKTFRATAYSHTGNKTRTGIWPKEGIIAVDPSVIPLRSTVYIEFPKGWQHLNGFYKAMDTGGAVKGNIVDVFLNTEGLCKQFGKRNVKIYFLK